MERAEIGAPPDLALVGDLIEGPLMHRRIVGRQPLTPDFLNAVAVSAHRLLTGTTVVS
jgi:hypothetical protein